MYKTIKINGKSIKVKTKDIQALIKDKEDNSNGTNK